MRFPVQARPIFRAFMREVVGRHWEPAGGEADAAAPKRGRRKKRTCEGRSAGRCLIELTTFAAPRGRGPFARGA